MPSVKINDDNFENDVLNSTKPVLIDFWAEWCGPCKSIAPALEEISDEMSSKLTVGKLNVDENPTISEKYNIRSIPALMIFKDGNIVAEIMGALPKSNLENWIRDHVS